LLFQYIGWRNGYCQRLTWDVDINTAEDEAEMNHSDGADLEMEGKVTAGVPELPPDRPVNSTLRSLEILVQTDWRHDSVCVC
jgi:hypothetical protein